jgi:hypothetical protein
VLAQFVDERCAVMAEEFEIGNFRGAHSRAGVRRGDNQGARTPTPSTMSCAIMLSQGFRRQRQSTVRTMPAKPVKNNWAHLQVPTCAYVKTAQEKILAIEQLRGLLRGPAFHEWEVGEFIELGFLGQGLRCKSARSQHANERGGVSYWEAEAESFRRMTSDSLWTRRTARVFPSGE